MKRTFYFLFACIMLGAITTRAEKFTVDNTIDESDPEQKLYKTLQEAYNRADDNDTIYVEGSATAYRSLTLTKPLTIIGPGYFLEENLGAEAETLNAAVSSFSFSGGSEGSKIEGLSFYLPNISISIATDDIEISQCLIQVSVRIARNSIRDLNLNRNFISSRSFILFSYPNISGPPINLYFANNIVGNPFEIPNGTTGGIINNIFLLERFNLGASSSLEIHNNILLSTTGTEIVVPLVNGTNVSHNIAALQTFGTANGNQINVLASQIFVEEGTTDGQYQIKADGLAAGTGRDGVDIGAFGGPEPYRLSGVPSIPRIIDLSSDGFVNEEGELVITIQATTN
ncbi:MAG: hypothetical protein AAF944_03190 [Bacteroidota bacterium]